MLEAGSIWTLVVKVPFMSMRDLEQMIPVAIEKGF